jgi:orotidine-5'-phosphate decarboxylase
MPRIESSLLTSSFGQRLVDVFAQRGQLCIGLDPSLEQLHKWGLPINAIGAQEFCYQVMAGSEGLVGILKPQVAFFEQFGSDGFSSLEKVLRRAQDSGFLVIADAKRGDIGSTMAGYATAWLSSEAPFIADALTVSPYLGADSLEETVSLAEENLRGIFLLAATSNPEGKELQASKGESGSSVASSIVSFASKHNPRFLGSVGVVIGAQSDLHSFGIDSVELSNTPILAPGFGAQGAKLGDVKGLFGDLAKSVIYNVSRSVAGDSPDGLEDRVLSAKQELKIGLLR